METVRWAAEPELDQVRSILKLCGLPDDDLADGVRFLVAVGEGRIIGVVGLEGYPPRGLLRSAAVLPACRGRGIGALLVEALVREAKAESIVELVLLTTTAEGFFRSRGFVRIDRETLDGPILGSGQFTGTRCASAAVMSLDLR